MTENSSSHTSRRRFLAGTGVAVGAAALGVTAGPFGSAAVAQPAPPPRNPGAGRLIVVFLRGGIDGMSVVVPAAESAYYAARPGIGVPESALFQLDDRFGLHPALAPLNGLWEDGRLGIVHAVGNPARSRSHFEAMDLLEQASVTRRGDASGWLARHLTSTSSSAPYGGLFRGVAISANSPGSLRGANTLSIPSLATFGLGGASGATQSWAPTLRKMYTGDLPVELRGTSTLDALTVVGAIPRPQGTPSAFSDAAALLDADIGVEVVTVDIGGWDTHNAMGTHTSGEMRDLLAGLGGQLAALQTDLDSRGLGDVTTIVMSEFGRRLLENASGGTDHGMGNVMLALGAGVAAGVHGTWPGLAADQLDRGDLAIGTDARDVLWDVAAGVLGNPNPSAIFAGHAHTPTGILA